MLDFIKVDTDYFLVIGYNFITKSGKRVLPVSQEEVMEMATVFSEAFAEAIGKKELQWSFDHFRLSDAPDHPFGWTDSRERTLLHYGKQSWHMIPPEIAEIGRLAKRVLGSNV